MANIYNYLPDLATDEIRGGFEVRNGERVRVPGVLESFNLPQEDAEMLILQARVAAGWIDASELPQPEPELAEEEGEDVYDEAEAVFGGESQAPEGEADAGEAGGDEGVEQAELAEGDAEVFAEDLEKSRDA